MTLYHGILGGRRHGNAGSGTVVPSGRETSSSQRSFANRLRRTLESGSRGLARTTTILDTVALPSINCPRAADSAVSAWANHHDREFLELI